MRLGSSAGTIGGCCHHGAAAATAAAAAASAAAAAAAVLSSDRLRLAVPSEGALMRLGSSARVWVRVNERCASS